MPGSYIAAPVVAEPPIPRRLEDGWDFTPGWRHQIIERNVLFIASAEDRSDATRQVLLAEKDPFIRQGTRFRLFGKCVNQGAFEHAFRAMQQNAKAGSGSLIKAMTVADLRPEEIARELGTTRGNIVTFQKLFWDIERYLGNELWLRTIAMPQDATRPILPEIARERQWLTVAYLRGWEGLQSTLQHRAPKNPEDLQEGARAIEAALLLRAQQFIASLDSNGIPATEHDFKYYLLTREQRSRELLTDAKEKQDRFQAWGMELVDIATKGKDDELSRRVRLKLGLDADPDAPPTVIVPRYRQRFQDV